MRPPQTPTRCPVRSYNEWDPLEEVIVGRVDGAVMPPYHPAVLGSVPRAVGSILRVVGGLRFPRAIREPARRELDGLVRLLEAEGVRVRRPEPLDGRHRFRTPHWSSRGFMISCPRDGFLVVGDEIIESPMPWRCRHFEANAYRALFKEYFHAGARWTSAPRPELAADLFDDDYCAPRAGQPLRYVTNEFEPVFDAADFMRFGRDLFVQRSNVTNRSGIEWLRRHLGDEHEIHEIETRCPRPMHIDTTFVPLAPGKLLVNPEYLDVGKLPRMFKSWDLLIAPPPDPVRGGALLRVTSMCGDWLSINVLSLDGRRVICERHQTSLIAALRDWGFEPIPLPFVHYAAFGGSFHCATLDIRRAGELQSYF